MAFGPPGTSAEENLSVVSGPLRPGSSLLGTLGPPEQAAANPNPNPNPNANPNPSPHPDARADRG